MGRAARYPRPDKKASGEQKCNREGEKCQEQDGAEEKHGPSHLGVGPEEERQRTEENDAAASARPRNRRRRLGRPLRAGAGRDRQSRGPKEGGQGQAGENKGGAEEGQRGPP